jgi:hypothetical protein
VSALIEDHDPPDHCGLVAVQPGSGKNQTAGENQPQPQDGRAPVVQAPIAAAGTLQVLIHPCVSKIRLVQHHVSPLLVPMYVCRTAAVSGTTSSRSAYSFSLPMSTFTSPAVRSSIMW